jgi:gluconokinase
MPNSQLPLEPRLVVVMGVSGCGKSSVGERIAEEFHCEFVEGDALHPTTNIDKMSAGIPLTDDDRWPWLDVIGQRISESRAQGKSLIVSCSSLKKVYRDRLRAAADGELSFVFLEGPRDVLEARMTKRPGHFMPASLLDTQFATLEVPTGESGVITVDLTLPLDALVSKALLALSNSACVG